MSEDKTPDQPEVPQGDEGAPPPDAPKKLDLHRTPGGHIPAAWKDLPPPEIIRAKPDEKEPAGEKFKNFLASPAAKQIGIAVGVVAVIGILVMLLSMPKSTETPRGAAQIYADALLANDIEGMKAVCTGMAVNFCEGHRIVIDRMVADGEASAFAEVSVTSRPAPESASRRAAEIICIGENGDPFLMIAMNLQKMDDETWRVSETIHQSLRGGSN